MISSSRAIKHSRGALRGAAAATTMKDDLSP